MCRTEDIKHVCYFEVVQTIKSVAWFSLVWGLLWHTSCHRVVLHLSLLLLHSQLQLCTSKKSLTQFIPVFAEQTVGFLENSRAQIWSSPVLPISTFIVRLALRCNMGLQGVYYFEIFFINSHLFWCNAIFLEKIKLFIAVTQL